MSMNDPLANMMSKILNAEKTGKKTCTVKPFSKLIKAVLTVMNECMYIGESTESEDGKGNHLTVNLLNKVNKCGAIKPRFAVRNTQYEKFEKRYLPAKNMGILIVSTPKGVMTHLKSKEQKLGGRLIAYCY
ncbi:MAG: 30S ribosomal protein S8 [Nanoarchaeota archaeon]|nr:30S ribosomal protein S8 [Nanoarchaeota archaeon]